MSKYIVGLLLSLLCLEINAQDTLFTYFSKQFRPDTTNLITVAIEPTDIGYLIAGIAGDEEDMSFVKALDQQGNELAELIIDEDEFEQWLTSGQLMTKGLGENEYWISYRKDYSMGGGLSLGEVVLAKVDDMANLLMYKELETPYNEDVRAICPAHDEGILVSGWRQWETGPTHIYVLKVDEEGNELWNFEYVDNPSHRTEVGNITPTADGGYLIGGAWSPNIGVTFIDWGYYIVKIDGEGIVEWVTKADIVEGQIDGLIETIELADGTILAHGYRQPSNDSGLHHLLHLSANGEILNEQFYSMYVEDEIFIGNGFYNNFIPYSEYFITNTHYFNVNAQAENLIWAIDHNLDTLWTKKIVLHTDTSIYFNDMEPTPDGGIIMAGYTPFQTPQYGWALKLDSLGNTCGNLYHCDSLVLEEVVDTNVGLLHGSSSLLSIHPNPSSGVFQFALEAEYFREDLRIEVYDVNGQLVWWEIASSTNRMIDLSNQLSGVYLLRLYEGEVLRAQRRLVVIE